MDVDRPKLMRLLRLGVKKRNIAELLEVSERSLYRYLQKKPVTEDDLETVDVNLMSDPLFLEQKEGSDQADNPLNNDESGTLSDDEIKRFLEGS